MNPQPEPTQDQELADVMKRIEAFTGGSSNESQALSGALASPAGPAALVIQEAAITPNAPVASEVQPPSDPAPETQPARSTPVQPQRGTPNVLGDAQLHDVVQVNDRDNQNHGVFFAIGAIKDGWVHGYVLKGNNGKEFITVKTTEVHRIGPAKVRSQVPCSRQWMEQHGREK